MGPVIEFLTATVTGPNLPYTVLLILNLLYWSFVILTGLDTDSLDVDLDGHLDLDAHTDIDVHHDVRFAGAA